MYVFDPYDLDALLALGVSFTNQIAFATALKYLREWIVSHPEYSSLAQQTKQSMHLHQECKQVVELFENATKINPDDPDLHSVLGVLFNITSEYDLAELHFKKALQQRPNDPTLWNKLGATQANGQKCHLAVSAYSKALQLKPNYVRALSNLGISFANQKMHREACQSYLASLRLNPHAESIWDYLTMSLLYLGREDLMLLTQQRDVSQFEKHFDF
ncbi:hypothetical protein RFI_01236 [Reticulomyxa filosa]|uniref:Uncharacterized protein n=1 Tax=Reticulomyxa filosa TaxID=46433 RepID=X6PCC7_RETFI|nr:hypothetical protein RFI_01236 [Reticulomyxa filosa]|eukprot:ETO35826.1 hypothetical protein RFI_01236 [Reticulomyxa filosa]